MSERDGLRWGEPPWTPADSVSASLPARCEVAVVGGGFTGLATALALARRGVDVALFEAGRLGAGASGRSGGLVLEDTAAGPLPGVEGCIDTLRRVVAEAGISCELSLPGCWELCHEPGEPLWRDGEGVLGIASVVPGGSLDCGRLVRGLAQAARDAGARLYAGQPVRALEDGRVCLHGGTVGCDRVVVALNAFTRELVDPGPDFGSALTLALLSEPLAPEALAAAGLAGGQVFYSIDLPYLWGRTLASRLLVGGGLALDPDGRLERIDIASGEVGRRLDALCSRVRGLHEALAGLSFARRFAGPVAFRAGRVPILAHVGRAIVTGAFAGHGVALSLRVAEAICEAIVADAPLPDWGRLEPASAG